MTEPEIKLFEHLDALQKSAHDEYLKTWSIITEGAENNGEYSNELLYQVIENQQKIAADLQAVAFLTAELVKLLEKELGKTLSF